MCTSPTHFTTPSKSQALSKEQTAALAVHREFEAAVHQQQQQTQEHQLQQAKQEHQQLTLETQTALSKEKMAMELELKLSQAVDEQKRLLQQAKLEHQRELQAQLDAAAKLKETMSKEIDGMKAAAEQQRQSLVATEQKAHLFDLEQERRMSVGRANSVAATRMKSVSFADDQKPGGPAATALFPDPSPPPLLSAQSRTPSAVTGTPAKRLESMGVKEGDFGRRFDDQLKTAMLSSGVSPEKVQYLDEVAKSAQRTRDPGVRNAAQLASNRLQPSERLSQPAGTGNDGGDVVVQEPLSQSQQIDDPASAGPEVLEKIRAELRSLMKADVNQAMDVKDLRQAACIALQLTLSSKPWKKWFNDAVAAIEDTLSSASEVEQVSELDDMDIPESSINPDQSASKPAGASGFGVDTMTTDTQSAELDIPADPSKLHEAEARAIKAELRAQMKADVEQLLDVKDLRMAVSTKLRFSSSSKEWKRWFNTAVEEIDAELEQEEESVDDKQVIDTITSTPLKKDVVASQPSEDVDDLSVSDDIGLDDAEGATTTVHNSADAEKSGSKYLKDIDDFVFSLVEQDTAGTITMKAVRQKVADRFGNDFSSASWKAWLKQHVQAAVDRVDGVDGSDEVEEVQPLDDIQSFDVPSEAAASSEIDPVPEESETSPAVAEEPGDCDDATLSKIKAALRKLMMEDEDQKLNVKDLRKAVSSSLGMQFDGKQWKRWFNDTVGDVDDELAEASEEAASTNGPGSDSGTVKSFKGVNAVDNAGPDKLETANAVNVNDVASVDEFDDIDELDDVENVSGGDNATKGSGAASTSVRRSVHDATDAENSDANYLKDVDDFVFSIVEKDTAGTITMKAVRQRVADRFGNDFSSASWKAWLKQHVQAAVDRIDGVDGPDDVEEVRPLDDVQSFDAPSESAAPSNLATHNIESVSAEREASPAVMADPDDCDDATVSKIKAALRKLMIEDEDQKLNVKDLRQAVSTSLRMQFDGKQWKRWFNNAVGEVDDELAEAAEDGVGDDVDDKSASSKVASIGPATEDVPDAVAVDDVGDFEEITEIDDIGQVDNIDEIESVEEFNTAAQQNSSSRTESSKSVHDATDAEKSDADYLKDVDDFVFSIVEKDTAGTITMKMVRQKVADRFGNDFSSASWKTWLKQHVQAAVDRIDGVDGSDEVEEVQPLDDIQTFDAPSESAAPNEIESVPEESEASPAVMADPDDCDDAALSKIKGALRKLMIEDEDQKLNVKDLRKAVASSLGMQFDGKQWKRWFNDAVGDVDDELASEGATASAPSHTTEKPTVRHNVDVASESDSSYLKEVSSFVHAVIEADTTGELTTKQVRAKVANKFDNDFSSPSWKAWLKQAISDAVDALEDGDSSAASVPNVEATNAKDFGFVDDPAQLSEAAAEVIRDKLRDLMFEDVDSKMNVKMLREAVSTQLNVQFHAKEWKWWFNKVVGELDDELADSDIDVAAAEPPSLTGKPGTSISVDGATDEQLDAIENEVEAYVRKGEYNHKIIQELVAEKLRFDLQGKDW